MGVVDVEVRVEVVLESTSVQKYFGAPTDDRDYE